MAGANGIAVRARQLEVHPLRLVLTALLTTAAAVAASLAIGGRAPFNEQYECCEAAQAEWKLIVDCSAGWSGDPEYQAFYRKRRLPLPGHGWILRHENTNVEYVECFCGGTWWATFGCGCGNGGSSQSFESCTLDPTDTAQGVDIAVEYERSENGQKLEGTKGVLSVPFRREVDCQLGSLHFRAKWERLK